MPSSQNLPPAPGSAPLPPRRRFLGWTRPLLPLVVQQLNQTAAADGTPLRDFSTCLIIVPTRHAGRQLREALAHAASGKAVLPPQVATPEAFFTLCRRPHRLSIATPAMTLMAWAAALLQTDPGSLSALLPIAPRSQTFRWARGLAQRLMETRRLLAEAGWSFASVSRRLPDGHPDRERWLQLAALERHAMQRLEQAGCIDADEAKCRTAAAPQIPDGVQRIFLAGTPDPLPVLVTALESIATSRLADLEVLIHAPPSEAAHFDRWGRPYAWSNGNVVSDWLAREIPLTDDAVRLCHDPRQEVETIRSLLVAHPTPALTATLGTADPELPPLLDVGATGNRLRFFNPEGRRAAEHEVWHLLCAATRLGAEQSFASFAALMRQPTAARIVRKRIFHSAAAERPWSQSRLLKELDRFQSKHFPGSLEDAVARSEEPLRRWVQEGLALAGEAAKRPPGDWIPAFLSSAFEKRRYPLDSPEGRDFSAIAAGLLDLLDEVQHAVEAIPLAMEPADLPALLLERLAEVPLPAAPVADGVNLLGWLELAWEEAAHVVVAGCNDGLVPDNIDGDAFLPDSLRTLLGVRSNATREARDAFLLTALTESRRHSGGRVDIVLTKRSLDGNPLRPSRLLLRRRGQNLFSRVEQLFGSAAIAPGPQLPAPSTCWRLQPPVPAVQRVPESIPVTAFREFLRCPLRFCFKHILRMRAVRPASWELDAAAFGTLCHAALGKFGSDSSLNTLTDPEKIHGHLERFIRDEVVRLCGKNPPVPVLIQQQSAIRRLEPFSHWHAESVRDGWTQQGAEVPFSQLFNNAEWRIDGIPLTIQGTIDRMDLHPEHGWRVLDFKTRETPKPPEKVHLATAKLDQAECSAFPWLVVPRGQRMCRWSDLQLPLYVMAFQEARSTSAVEAGYFEVAKSADKSTYVPWNDLDADLLASARACAAGILQRIQDADYRTAVTKPLLDDFDHILLHDPSRSVAASFLLPANA